MHKKICSFHHFNVAAMAISDLISVLELFDLQHTFFVKGLITDLGLGFSTVQCVQVVNSTL